MSTNHTPHFNLSQWEPDDQVLRTDFNEDNAKIDAALNLSFRRELIMEVTAQEDVFQLEAEVSNLDWSQYLLIVVEYVPNLEQSSSADVILLDANRVYVDVNSTSPSGSGNSVMCTFNSLFPSLIIFLSLHRQENAIRCYSITSFDKPAYKAANWGRRLEDIKVIQLKNTNSPIPAGSSIRITGIQ